MIKGSVSEILLTLGGVLGQIRDAGKLVDGVMDLEDMAN